MSNLGILRLKDKSIN